MENSIFKTNDQNPLTELSELRLELSPSDEGFELKCRLLFGKMQYEHNEREYEVGVSRAHLRLLLEGCERTLGSTFGESLLAPVIEEDRVEERTTFGIEASCSTGFDPQANAKVSAGADACSTRTHNLSQSKVRLPVEERPNNSWEIKVASVTNGPNIIIEGTAISNSTLCALRRKSGHNRIAVVGEVQVPKSAIRVNAKGGNHLHKIMSEWKNKDAIISQILKRAIQREAAATIVVHSSSTVAISRYECLEE